MVATFDRLKDEIKSIASSPVSPIRITADGRAGDPFPALNYFCTCVYVLYVSDHRELDYTFGEIIHLYTHRHVYTICIYAMSVILCCPAIMSPTTPSPPFIPPFLPSFFAYSPINRPETCRIGEIQSNGDHRQLQRNWLLHSWFEGHPLVGFAAQQLRVQLVDKF